MYTSLLRLQQPGWIGSDWGVSESNRKAKFYAITKARTQAAAIETSNWGDNLRCIGRVHRLESEEVFDSSVPIRLRGLFGQARRHEFANESNTLNSSRAARSWGTEPKDATRAAHVSLAILRFSNSIKRRGISMDDNVFRICVTACVCSQ